MALAEHLDLLMDRFKSGPRWLYRLRTKFIELYRSMPPEASDLYIRHYEAPSLDEAILSNMLGDGVEREVPDEFRHLKEDLKHPTAIYVGTRLMHLYLPKDLAKAGVEFLDFDEALKKHENSVQELFQKIVSSPYLDKYASLTHALLNSGIFIKVPSAIEISEPFRIIYILDRSSEAVFSKTIMLTGEQSKLSVIEELHGLPGSHGCVFGHHLELVVNDSSAVKHGVLQNLAHDHTYMGNRLITLGRHSTAMVVGALIGGGLSKVRVDNVMEGDGSSVNDLELVFGDGDQKMDLTANLHHIGLGTQGREIAKGVVKERSRIFFKGMITIEKNAKNTNAYLAKHAMIMSPEARAYAIPSLEIKTDDVKATHSASVSQIDPDQIYYLMTRGIPYEEARKMLALGFFEPVVSMIDFDEVRWGLRSLLESKWGGSVTELFEEPEVTVSSLFGTHYKYRYGK